MKITKPRTFVAFLIFLVSLVVSFVGEYKAAYCLAMLALIVKA